jgi:hypothetical protein
VLIGHPPPADAHRVFRVRGISEVTTSKVSKADALADIAAALRTSLAIPTDTMITEDIPLLLTRLSGQPYAPPTHAGAKQRDPAGPPKS